MISCSECGWCHTVLTPRNAAPFHTCEQKLFNKEGVDFVLKIRRCRSFATREEVDEIKKVEKRSW